MNKSTSLSFWCFPQLRVTASQGSSSLTMGLRGVTKRRGQFVIKCVKSSDVLMQRVQLPKQLFSGPDLEKALAFKTEEQLPFPVDEALFTVPYPPDGLYLATSKERLPEGPYDAVTSIVQALVHFISYFELPDTFLLVYADEHEVTFIEIENGKPVRHSYISRNAYYELEFARRCKAYGWQERAPALILGERVAEKFFKEELRLEPRFGLNSDELQEKALLVGMALMPFALPFERFDFAKKRVSFKKIPLVKPLFLAALSFVLLFWVSEEFLASEEKALAHRMHVDDIHAYIQAAQEKLSKPPYPYPLKPQVPAFSDFLAWISEQAPEGIQFDKIHYTLISLPTIKNPKERYVVQVELAFLADSAQTARLLHEHLTTANPFVEQDKHFSWHSSDKGYRTVFRLKDKTYYDLS